MIRNLPPATLSACPTTLKYFDVQLPSKVKGVVCRRAADQMVQEGTIDQLVIFLDPECKRDCADGIACVLPEGQSGHDRIRASLDMSI